MEPDYIPDEGEGLEIFQKELGKAIFRETKPLPERTDVIKYNPDIHQE